MAIQCPKCHRQYDITLFEFGQVITCECGEKVDATKPQVLKIQGKKWLKPNLENNEKIEEE